MRCNRKKLAAIFGLDVKTIDKMVRDGMPYVSRPGAGMRSWVFDTAAVLKWMTGDTLDERIKRSRSKLLEARAGIKWLEYGRQLGFLVPIPEVITRYEEVLWTVKSRLLAIPGRFNQAVAIESDPAVIEPLLQQEIADIFAQSDRQMTEAIEDVRRNNMRASPVPQRRPTRRG